VLRVKIRETVYSATREELKFSQYRPRIQIDIFLRQIVPCIDMKLFEILLI
jgi:hypothetical protein